MSIESVLIQKLPTHALLRILALLGYSKVSELKKLNSLNELSEENKIYIKKRLPEDFVDELLMYFPDNAFLLEIKNTRV